jgi:uncharacterized membrane protein HdeD (DUF308 family)
MWVLFSMAMMVLHRQMARQAAAFYQNWPEMKAKLMEWSGLLGGAMLIVMGLGVFAYPHHRLAAFFTLILGFVCIFLGDSRRVIAWSRSEKYWRIQYLLGGMVVVSVGVLRILNILD